MLAGRAHRLPAPQRGLYRPVRTSVHYRGRRSYARRHPGGFRKAARKWRRDRVCYRHRADSSYRGIPPRGFVHPGMSMFEDLRRQYINLAQPRLGSEVVYATDDFFADKARLIDPAEPAFIPGKYDENGKWMDGWESRRRRIPGHDWCVVRLGIPGRIAGFEIDTRHFTGNYPPS